MTISGHPLISIAPDICGGRPCIAGTRVRVVDILNALASGESVEELAADFPYLSEERVRAAIRYAADVQDHSVVMAAD